MCSRQGRVTREHAHGVVNGVISMRGHSIRFVRQTFEGPFKFFAIAGKTLDRLYAHAKDHDRKDCRMLCETF